MPNTSGNIPTPPVPIIGKITVSYQISLDADGNGYFDENGVFHKLPSITKYKTGDAFNMPLMIALGMMGLALIAVGIYGLAKGRKGRKRTRK